MKIFVELYNGSGDWETIEEFNTEIEERGTWIVDKIVAIWRIKRLKYN